MLYICLEKFNEGDKDFLEMVLIKTGFKKDDLRFFDLSNEDVDTSRMRCILTLGKAIVKVSRAFSAAGIYKPQQMLKDVVDPEKSYLVVHMPMNVSDLRISEEDKSFAKIKLSFLLENYNNKGDVPVKVIKQISNDLSFKDLEDPIFTKDDIEVPKEFIEEAIIEVLEEVVEKIVIKSDTSETESDNVIIDSGIEKESITINVNEALNTLFKYINLNDVALGKSLSKYPKFVLNTDSGDLFVYPTSRFSKTDIGSKITIKDLILLLKAGDQFGSEEIKVYLKEVDT